MIRASRMLALTFGLICTTMFAHSALAFDHSHKVWTEVLQKHVQPQGASTSFNYKALKADSKLLSQYTKSLSAVTFKEFAAFSTEQKEAFLINAYNAFTVQIVLKNYPVKSIKDIGSLFRNTWKIKFIPLFGSDVSLDEIEHENLRKNFNEPRVHFAVNCASIGCPALRAEAFVPERLSQQLDEQANLFLRDTSRNRLNEKSKKLELSMIFKWFKEDFEKNGGSVQKFVAPYMTDDPKVQAQISKGAFNVSHLDYDWGLNQTKD